MGEYDGVVGGVSSIVTDGFKPWWNGYENTVQADIVDDHDLTAREAYESALNWQVALRDVLVDTKGGTFEKLKEIATHLDEYVKNPDSTEARYEAEFAIDALKEVTHDLVIFDKKKATVKEDDGQPLGIVGDGFGVTQNEILLELAEALKTHADVYCESAGSLFGFRQAWMLLKLGEDKYFADGGEQLARFLLLALGHDGTLAVSGRPTEIRVECMNTFEWAIAGTKSLFTIRHTKNAMDRVEEAKKIISSTYDHFNAMDDEIEQLLAMEYSRTQYQDILVPALVGAKPDEEGRALTNWEKKRDGLVASYERPDQRNIAGTGWGAVMAVNSYENWGVSVRGQSRAEMQARKAVKGDFPLTAQAKELVLN